jgi:signal transduction histidine kinase
MGELAGQVAHEVNNPIGIVSAKARLLVDHHRGEMSEHVAAELEKITTQSDRVARVAQGLLTYCRTADLGRAAAKVDVAVKRAIHLIEPRAHQSKVTIEEQLPDDLPRVRANSDELEQVFCNLFINALDAMPTGGRLCVAAACDGDHVAISVQDSGCGMTADVRARIFDPFFTTKKQDGTGLGLSICQELVHASGGSIVVESEPTHGSKFTLRLAIAHG